MPSYITRLTFLLPIIVILSITLSLASCASAAIPLAAPAPELIRPVEAPADLAPVRRGDIKPVKVAEGLVVPYSRGLAFSSSDAPISAIYVAHGQSVSEGELLAELDKEPWLDRLANARGELDHLLYVAAHEDRISDIRLELARMDADEATGEDERYIAELNVGELMARDVIRRETAELDIARLRARIAALEAQKDDYTIYAPFDGVVLSIESLTIGDYPSGRTPFLFLADLNQLTIRALTEQTSFFTTAQELIAVIGDKEWPIEVVPYTIEEMLAFYYEGVNPPARFKFVVEGGAFETGKAPPTEKRVLIMARDAGREDVIMIPVNAARIETAGDEEGGTSRQDYAYVDVNGVRVRRDIKCGGRSDIWIEVVEGLSEGELVYVD